MNISLNFDIGLMATGYAADKNMTDPSLLTPKEVRLRKACQGFEAIITRRLFAAMRKSTGDDPIFGRSFAKEMYESMQDDIIATKISRNNHSGLADVLYRQLSPTLAATSTTASRVDEVA